MTASERSMRNGRVPASRMEIGSHRGFGNTIKRDDAESKGTLRVGMICHELRNSVGALQNGISLVGLAGASLVRLAPIAEMMQRQLDDVIALIDDLDNGTCLASDKLDIRNDPVDLGLVSENALDAVDRLIRQREQELSLELPPIGTVWVRGDRRRMIQVVVNLLTNASKFTEPGGLIGLALQADRSNATLTVRDSGRGIPAHFLASIFEVGTRGAVLPDATARGQGFGLPMVRNFVSRHGGKVSAYSAGDGQGSKFTVELPRLIES